MVAADTPNREALAKLTDLLHLAEDLGLYLDITGLGCYHKRDTPAWYDALGETERWKVQAAFWSAIARTCRKSPAVFCYDLMNEPVIDGKTDQGWVTGELGGKFFVQRLTLEKGSRTPTEIAKAWVGKLTAAIRAEDPEHMITVGVIPWAMVWPNAKPVFYSSEASGPLDFVSIHVYPNKGEVEKALAALAVYDIGKPLLIEETFPLSCTLEEMDEFLKKSRLRAEGYISFYWGKTIDEYSKTAKTDITAALVLDWLRYFQRHAEEMKHHPQHP